MQLAPAAGGFGLGQLVGSLYEKEAQKEGPNPSCYGPHCFRYNHFPKNCLLSSTCIALIVQSCSFISSTPGVHYMWLIGSMFQPRLAAC